jgi:hypothetical protein
MKLLVNIFRFIYQKYATYTYKQRMIIMNKTMQIVQAQVSDMYTKINERIERQVLLKISNDSDDFDTTIEHYIEVL